MRVVRHHYAIGLSALVFALGQPLAASAQEAAAELEHPLAGSKLLLADGSKANARRIVFKARFAKAAALDNPTFAGATLRVYGTKPADGDTGVIQLAGAKWHGLGRPAGSAGYQYRDPSASAGGIRSLLVRQKKNGGILSVTGGDANW